MFLPFFLELKAAKVPVSLREYLSLLEGMEAGLVEYDVEGFYYLARAALPHLKSAGAGRFVILASLAGKRVLGPGVGYQMTKHAAVALAHAVRLEGWEAGVRALAVCPGLVDTDLVAGIAGIAKEEMIDAESLARLVVTTMTLPNNASVAELLVNCRYEHSL